MPVCDEAPDSTGLTTGGPLLPGGGIEAGEMVEDPARSEIDVGHVVDPSVEVGFRPLIVGPRYVEHKDRGPGSAVGASSIAPAP
jgi:hypothetical protein